MHVFKSRDFISLVKPGIIFGNLLTAFGGFFVASRHAIHHETFIHHEILRLPWMLVGLAFIVASGCTFNNVIDRDIDRMMKRTRSRPLARGTFPPYLALLYGLVLGALGSVVLYVGTNGLTLFFALLGFALYVFSYSLFTKRTSVYGTLVGSFAGALPPLIGYVALSGRVDSGAIILFLMLFFWQFPHFYAITLYRIDDYRAASIPVLPLAKGIISTKVVMLLSVLLFSVSGIALNLLGYVGDVYLSIFLFLCVFWIGLTSYGFLVHNTTRWARSMFFFSLIVINTLFIGMIF